MTSYVSPLTAIGDAIYGLLVADSTLAGFLPGGVQTDVPENPTYPFLWIELLEDTQEGGFGPWPAAGAMPGLELRLHAYQSQYGTMRDAQVAIARAIELVSAVDGSGATTLTATGYAIWLVAYEQTIPLPREELNGVPVQELVARFRLIVEEQ
jgi:hypothetical protein